MRRGRNRRTAAHAAARRVIVGVIGLGAVGSVVAATLAKREDVRVLVRDARGADMIANQGGIVLDNDPPQPVRVSNDVAVLAGCEIVLICLKTYSTIEALMPFRDTPLARVPYVAFQNGIDSTSQISYALGTSDTPIALAPTTMAAMRDGTGRSRLMGPGLTNIGWERDHRGDDALLAAFVATLSKGISAELVAPVEPYLWAKLVANAAINPITALGNVTNGNILTQPALHDRAVRLALEVVALAERSGIPLPFDDPLEYLDRVIRNTASNRSSMLEDLTEGRQTELDSITGAVVRRGKTLEIPTPENALVYDEVRARLKA